MSIPGISPGSGTSRPADFILVDHPEMYFERLARKLTAAGFSVLHIPQAMHLATRPRWLQPTLRRMLQEILAIPEVIARCSSAPSSTVLIVPLMHLAYLAVARLLLAVGRRRPLYLVNFYFHSRSEWKIFRFVMRRLLTDAVGISVQSPNEREFYRELSKRVTLDYVPYGQDQHSVWDPSPHLARLARGPYVFTGGYTNRDYPTFIRAGAQMPDARFLLVCSRHNSFDRQTPHNVTVIEDVSFRDFHALLARATVVVVPLLHDSGSSGQMVALAGMSYGVPVIYTDFSTIAQYFVPDVTGVPVPCGDVDAMTRAITRLLESPDRAKSMGEAARSAYLQSFTTDISFARIADSVAAFRSAVNAP